MRRILVRLMARAAVALVLARHGTALAAPLDLVLSPYPDIHAGFLTVSYSPEPGVMQVYGSAFALRTGPAPTDSIDIASEGSPTTAGTFALFTYIYGDLVVSGAVDLDGDGTLDRSGLLLIGQLAEFGASSSGPGVLEFVFDVTGGELVPDVFPMSQVGVFLGLGPESTFDGRLDVEFENLTKWNTSPSGAGSADLAPIEEPLPEPEPPGVAQLLGTPIEFPFLAFDGTDGLHYDAATGMLHIAGVPSATASGGGSPGILVLPELASGSESITIDANLDASGTLTGDGTFEVVGRTQFQPGHPFPGDFSGVLLSGRVTDFGFQDAGPVDSFEFSGVASGGQLAPFFGEDVVIHFQSEDSTFTGSFTEDFSGGAKGVVAAKEVPVACNDGIDNDHDGLVDFPADGGCSHPYFTREYSQCQDGIDNQGDGTIDFDGGAWTNHGIPLAPPDPRCEGNPSNSNELVCGLGAELAIVMGLLWRWKRSKNERGRT